MLLKIFRIIQIIYFFKKNRKKKSNIIFYFLDFYRILKLY